MTRVGYVGLGAMGRALARHLVQPFNVVVWDVAPSAVERLVAEGAAPASSLEALASDCDVVILCLPTSSIVQQVLFGEGGLASHLAPGTLVIDQTSGVPEQTRAIASRLAETGVALIDAPVAGGVPSAIAGQITIMASGPADAFERARPVLLAISPKLFLCGPEVGAGQATKAINNLINTGYRMATLELLGLACRMGHSAAALTDAFNAGGARSFVTQRLLPAVVDGRSSADFALGLMCKDVNQAADLALATGASMPVCDAARALMNIAHALLGPDSRLDDLVPLMERMTGAAYRAYQPAAIDQVVDVGVFVTAMEAANRAVMIECIDLARRAGLTRDAFGPVIGAGSGASAQGDRLLSGAECDGGPFVEALDELSRIAGRLGVPLPMTSQIRAAHIDGTASKGTTS